MCLSPSGQLCLHRGGLYRLLSPVAWLQRSCLPQHATAVARRFNHLGHDNMARLVGEDMGVGMDVPAGALLRTQCSPVSPVLQLNTTGRPPPLPTVQRTVNAPRPYGPVRAPARAVHERLPACGHRNCSLICLSSGHEDVRHQKRTFAGFTRRACRRSGILGLECSVVRPLTQNLTSLH